MDIYAIIDIGSFTTKLTLLGLRGGGIVRVDKQLSQTRLGGDKLDNMLSPDAIDRVVKAVLEFIFSARNRGANEVFVFATSAARDAKNKHELIDAVYRASGIRIEVLSADKEAQCAFLGATMGRHNTGVIDIGGGSTEIVFAQDSQTCSVSFNVGALRNTQTPGANVAVFKNWLMDNNTKLSGKTFFASGGTACALAALGQKLERYDFEKIHGSILSYDKLCELNRLLRTLAPRQRQALPGMPDGRGAVIEAGSAILLTFMRTLRLERVTVSDYGAAEGYFLKKLKNSSDLN